MAPTPTVAEARHEISHEVSHEAARHGDREHGEYSDYDAAAKTYDSCRSATDVVHVRDLLRSLPKPVDELKVLDYGCGTGNYLSQIAPIVSEVTGVEPSEGMVSIARQKLSRFPGSRVQQIEHGNYKLPFADGEFDAIMCTQVIHHIANSGGKDALSLLTKEWHRVLAPGGIIILNHTFPEQLQAFWYVKVLSDKGIGRSADFKNRFASRDLLQYLAQQAGLNWTSEHPCPEPLQGPGYYDRHGYNSEAWRNCDSFFHFIDESLSEALPILDAVSEAEIKALRRLEQQVCQTTTISMRKPRAVAGGLTTSQPVAVPSTKSKMSKMSKRGCSGCTICQSRGGM